jgi:hypothetical protein
MAQTECTEFASRFNAFMAREGLDNLSSISGESYFTWARCECCGDIAGMREDCDGYSRVNKRVQGPYSVCEQCVYFADGFPLFSGFNR